MSFPLLRILCFARLDANSNGTLDLQEFPFTLKVPDEFFVMNANGTNWQSLFLFEGHSACGSPAVSPDGKQIAFDAWNKNQQGESAMYVMSIDGGDPREIALGMMPNWSKDGTQIACSRYQPTYGAWVMELNGDGHKHLGRGWGAQFSPDGTKIAFSEGAVLKVHNLKQETTVSVLDGEANPYQHVYWNSAWSPDGKRICFKGTKADGTQEIATVSVGSDTPDLKVHFSSKQGINADFAWHPTDDRILFSMYCVERSRTQLYEFNPNKLDAPKLVEGQAADRNNTDVCWTPDGERLIIVSGDY
jgi:TolB protein